MPPTIDVFILGPMGGGVPGADTHTKIMKRAVETLCRDEALDGFNVEVPDDELGAAIVEDVFAKIDRAELVVADISTRSPNVFYEVAFAHALGLPTILLSVEGADIPFYFRNLRIHPVLSFDEPTIADTLRPIFRAIHRGERPDLTANPLTLFYGAPVVDISAAVGLAAGYFQSFVAMIAEDGKVLDARAGELHGLAMVLPEKLGTFTEDWAAVRDRLIAAGFPPVRIDVPRSTADQRTISVFVAGGWIVDLPTTLYTLSRSQRYRKRHRAGHAVEKAERSLIDAFQRAMEMEIDSARGTLRRDRLIFTPLSAIERDLLPRMGAGQRR